jgi:hypothetical protein
MDRDELQQAMAAAVGEPLMGLEAELRVIRRLIRPAGRPFTDSDAGNTDAGGFGIVRLEGPMAGQAWLVDGFALSTGGASAAASCSVYVGQPGRVSADFDERNLVAFAGVLVGNSPSRFVSALTRPIAVLAGESGGLSFVLRGAVAAAQPITVRAWGQRVDVADVRFDSGPTWGNE